MGFGMDAIWGFDLDLDSPSPDPAPARGDAREGEPTVGHRAQQGIALPAEDEIEISPDDTDEDIAPALRAKRWRA